MTDLAKLARDLKPYILPWVTGGAAGGSAAGGAMVAHELSGASHTGQLAQSQATWAATAASLNAHMANANAHHARQHSYDSASDHAGTLSWVKLNKTGASLADLPTRLYSDLQTRTHSVTGADHSIGGAAFDLVGNDGVGLGLLTPSPDVGGGTSAILRSAAGVLGVLTLNASNVDASVLVETPLLQSPGAMDIAAGGALEIMATGDITVDAGGADVIFDYDDALRADNYAAGFPLAGWRLGPTSISGQSGFNIGLLEADELRARIFVADNVRVDQGQEYITKGYGILSRPFTTPGTVGGTGTIYFENSPNIAGALFTANDWVLLRYLDMSSGLVLTSIWGQVSAYAGVGANEQSWTFTLRAGRSIAEASVTVTGWVIKEGAIAVGFGASGQGYILSDAITSTSPSITIGKWTSNPYTPANRKVHAAMGRLDTVGFSGEYGFAATVDNWTASGTWWKAGTGGVKQNNVTSEWYKSGAEFLKIDSTVGLAFNVVAGAAWDANRAIRWRISGADRAMLGTTALSYHVITSLGVNEAYNAFETPLQSNSYASLYMRALAHGMYAATPTIANADLVAGYKTAGGVYSEASVRATATSGNLGLILDAGTAIELISALVSVLGNFEISSWIRTGNGAVGTPAVSFTSDPNTGLYRSAEDVLAFATGGALRVSFANALARVSTPTQMDSTLAVTGAATLSSTLAAAGEGTFDSAHLRLRWGAPFYGMSVQASPSGGWDRRFQFHTSATGALGGFGALGGADTLTYWYIGSSAPGVFRIYPGSGDAYIHGALTAERLVANTGVTAATANMTTGYYRDGVKGLIYVPVTPAELTTDGALLFNGAATARATGAYHFDMDLAANGSIPAESVAVVLLISGMWAAAANGNYMLVKKYGAADSDATLHIRASAANIASDAQGVVELDTTYNAFTVTVAGANVTYALVRLIGYYI